ncbi:hypothetical protein C8R34_11923 [Nitrosomonas sp. Nm84]|nr:hypothetical protein C8R34_11923 [Nitrosomonas sp. Nm84]
MSSCFVSSYLSTKILEFLDERMKLMRTVNLSAELHSPFATATTGTPDWMRFNLTQRF